MKSISLTLFLSILFLTAITQNFTSFSVAVPGASRNPTGGTAGGSNSAVIGSPYLDEYFFAGSIELSNGEIIENVQLRYNVNADVLEIENEGTIMEINKPDMIRKVVYNDRHFIYNPYLVQNSNTKNGYFEVLAEGALTLYLKRTNDIQQNNGSPNYSSGGTGQQFYKMEDHFYFKNENNEVFPLNKNKFLDNIQSHKSDLKDYIKKRRVKFNDKMALKKMISYYNGLD